MPRVWLTLSAREKLLQEADRTKPKETGGVLIGYRGEQDTIVIADIVGPGPRATHMRYSFAPDHEYQEQEIARIYEASGRVRTYLGDWHSHPRGSATMSTTDRRTLRRIARTRSARQPEPLMLIISGGTRWSMTVHRAVHTAWRVIFEELTFC
jgi:integrative and conjugative element protein (TIGR02256 family)